MKDQFVSYPIALKLKELGFDEEVLGYFRKIIDNCLKVPDWKVRNLSFCDDFDDRYVFYIGWDECPSDENLIKAPLWQQVIDWLREKYNLDIIISSNLLGYGFIIYQRYPPKNILDNREFQYYCEAREQAILKALTLVK